MISSRVPHLSLLGALAVFLAGFSMPASAKEPVFLIPDAIDLRADIPPPPAKGSPEEAADQAELEKTFRERTPTEIEAAARADNDSVFDFITVLGPGFNASALPDTKSLFKSVNSEVKPLVKKAKVIFARPRTMIGGKKLTGTDDDFGYPSGHAARAALWATLLADAFPAKYAALSAQADQMGWNRVILGFHYPADIRAGRLLGAALAKAFLKNPAFLEKWKVVQAELATVQVP
ncbi:MAG: phosphatase PAP2 family protein [Verrucomicrobiota bacterium]